MEESYDGRESADRPPDLGDESQKDTAKPQEIVVFPKRTGHLVNRNDISFDDWMAMDMKYIEERSFWVDWKIIFMTVKAVVCKQGE